MLDKAHKDSSINVTNSRLIIPQNKLLDLTSKEAEELAFSRGTVTDVDDLLQREGVNDYNITTLELTPQDIQEYLYFYEAFLNQEAGYFEKAQELYSKISDNFEIIDEVKIREALLDISLWNYYRDEALQINNSSQYFSHDGGIDEIFSPNLINVKYYADTSNTDREILKNGMDEKDKIPPDLSKICKDFAKFPYENIDVYNMKISDDTLYKVAEYLPQSSKNMHLLYIYDTLIDDIENSNHYIDDIKFDYHVAIVLYHTKQTHIEGRTLLQSIAKKIKKDPQYKELFSRIGTTFKANNPDFVALKKIKAALEVKAVRQKNRQIQQERREKKEEFNRKMGF